ncbi:MAG TPA: HIT domain-containing protein [Fimbriimonas sp.]|nr:HIT domain-containing protein [Fimbriimonas sp.]
MKYIAGPKGSGNIFVDLPAQADDRTNLILYRGETAFVLLNAYPYSSGHLMIATYRQTNDLESMTDAELLEINQLVAKAVGWLRQAYRPEGFNIGVNLGSAAGAGIPIHAHWHVVPRWNGDTNFMTTVGEVRVIPQELTETYDKLKAIIDAGS